MLQNVCWYHFYLNTWEAHKLLLIFSICVDMVPSFSHMSDWHHVTCGSRGVLGAVGAFQGVYDEGPLTCSFTSMYLCMP